jgi:N-acetylmuramoyl-L-alanine amidase
MPAILIEAGFIDNCKTYESFKDELSLVAIAQATLLGISDYFDIVGEG